MTALINPKVSSAEVINFKSFDDYVSFNQEYLSSNPLLNFFLVENINKAWFGKVPVHKFFNITDENNCHLTVLLTKEFCLLYGNSCDDKVISLLSQELEFNKFKRYYFAGSKAIIDALFDLNKSTYELEKHRIVYKCEKVSPSFNCSPGEMRMGDMDRLNELAEFSVDFAKSYEGQVQTFDHMKEVMFAGIMNDNIYQWNYGKDICSIAQAIHNDEFDFPVIGHVYTNPKLRNKGFAASLVHGLTAGLLGVENDFCMLVTDAKNPASNKAFIKVGYQATGDYARVYKKIF